MLKLAATPPTAKICGVGGRNFKPVNGVITIDHLSPKEEEEFKKYLARTPALSQRFRLMDRDAALRQAKEFLAKSPRERQAAMRGGLDAGRIAAQQASALTEAMKMGQDPEQLDDEMKKATGGAILPTETVKDSDGSAEGSENTENSENQQKQADKPKFNMPTGQSK